MTKITEEQIDNYHSGRMSDSEMAEFNKAIESDPSVKAESDFQSDIVNGLKEYRKLELKSRLDAINVGPTWIEFAQQSALMKSFGGVVIASLIGTGIYFYGEKPEIVEYDQDATVEAQEVESIEFVWQLGEEEKENTETQLIEKPVVTNISKVDENQVAKEEEIVSQDLVADESNTVSDVLEVKEVYKPSFEAPNAEAVGEDAAFETTGLDEIPATDNGDVTENSIDVLSEITKSSTIKYKYYDGKLFLNGAFDKAPYEILEINSKSGRRIYVYYLGSYYKVGNADKLTELPKVTNPQVIDELKTLRENK
ncbi:hypothetical protein [Ekhidna sp.]